MTTPAHSTSRFIPLLVVGDEAATSEQTALALGRRLGNPVEPVTLDTIGRFVRVPGGVGAVIYAAPAGDQDGNVRLGALLDSLRVVDPGLPVFVLADRWSSRDLAAAMRRGAADALFIEHDGDVEARERLEELVRRRSARAQGVLFDEKTGAPRLLGASVALREVARLVERVAGSDATVLILGESGTGKELVAHALHVFSPRRRGPFVAINCAAIPETLLENELFGHEKGSYTGASSTAMGKVEAAEKGTLFLDEIGEMPLPLQAKILRLLQEKTYDRIGGARTRKADVRIIAATNRDLKEEVTARRFREDLYYRLSVVPIPLPSLRERPEDIPLLARAFLERLAQRLGRPGLALSPEAMKRLVAYRWPGNVRELENELERAAVLCGRDAIGPGDLELRSRVDDPDRRALARLAPLDGPLDATIESAARRAAEIRIGLAFEETGGDRARAAERLGISLEDLERRLESGQPG